MAEQTVLHVADFGGPPGGGNFIACLSHLREALKRNGQQMVAVFPERARERPWFGGFARQTPVEVLAEKRPWRVQARDIVEICDRVHPVIIHTHFAVFDTPCWLAARHLNRQRVEGERRCELIWHHHSPHFSNPGIMRWIRSSLIKYRCMGRRVYHVSVSEGGAAFLRRAGVPPDRLHVVLNGIDSDWAMRRERSGDEVRQLVGLSGEQEVVLLFGWEPLTKGVDVAIKGFEAVARRRPGAALVIVGRERTEEYLKGALGPAWPAWLHLVPPRELAAEYYAAADVFLTASRREGLPYSVLEALLNGLPVVGSRIPGFEWADSVPAFEFFPSEDDAALAEAVDRVLSWPRAERDDRCRRSQEIIRSRFSTSVWADQIMQLYRRVLGGA